MIHRSLVTRCAAALLASAALLPAALAQQPAPPAKPGAPIQLTPEQQKALEARRKARVYAKDLEGLWVNAAYLDALKAVRMPRQAAAKAPPVAVNIMKDGRSYPMLRTNFDKASILSIIDIQPEPGEGRFRVVLAQDDRGVVSATDVKHVSFRGKKNDAGRFETLEIAEPLFGKARLQIFRRAEQGLGPLVNGLVLAGKYVDEKGAEYEFTAEGEARLPGEAFPYEVRLSRAGANCEMIESPDDGSGKERKRIGFAWKAGRLELYAIDVSKPGQMRCGAKPVAVLVPAR
jgi:hypothetical protein